MLAFGAVVISVELANVRFNEYSARASQTSEAWQRVLDLLVYLVGIVTNLITIIFSTLTGAVVSDLFKSTCPPPHPIPTPLQMRPCLRHQLLTALAPTGWAVALSGTHQVSQTPRSPVSWC